MPTPPLGHLDIVDGRVRRHAVLPPPVDEGQIRHIELVGVLYVMIDMEYPYV